MLARRSSMVETMAVLSNSMTFSPAYTQLPSSAIQRIWTARAAVRGTESCS